MRNNSRVKRLFAGALAAILIAAAVPTAGMCYVQAKPKTTQTSEEQKANEEKSADLAQQKKDAENKVNDAQDAVTDAEGTKMDLESQADAVADRIREAQSAIANTSSQIDSLQAELSDAHQKQSVQYGMMKKRIRYMYELNPDDRSVVMILFSSEGIADFLNRFEYVAELTSYDQDMVKKYKDLQDTIASKSKRLAEDEAALEADQTELSDQQQKLSGLLVNASDDLKAKYADLTEAQDHLDDINEAIREFQSALQAEEAANAARKAAEAESVASQIEAEQQEQERQQQAAAQAELAKRQAELEQAKREAAAKEEAARKAAEAKAAAEKAAAEAAARAQAAKDAAAKKEAEEAAARAKAEQEKAEAEAAARAAEAAQAQQDVAAKQAAADAAAKNLTWKQTNAYGQCGTVYYVKPMAYTQKDLDEFTTLIYCEAGNVGYDGQLAVASVITNRVRSKWFAQNTLHGIMFASGQFEPTWLKREGKWEGKTMFQYFYDNRAYMQQHYRTWNTCRQAALDALSGKRNTNLCFYWALTNSRPQGSIVYGGQVFFGRVVQMT